MGQNAQPLAKIASGGELSRISLAVQVLTANKLSTPTIIFDEVDVGISGIAATTVGKLLRQLGNKCQVLCVTHLPQVASHGHQHFNVQKYVKDNQTETQMSLLSEQERINALSPFVRRKQNYRCGISECSGNVGFGERKMKMVERGLC